MERAAVFSDVEGTLISGSLPQLFLDAARQLKLFPPLQRLQVDVLDGVAKVLPGKYSRLMQFVCLMQSVVGHTASELQPVADAMIEAAMQQVKLGSLARLQAHQQTGLPLVLISGGMHPGIVTLANKLGARGEGTKVQLKNGRFTSTLDGPVCQGEGKAARARAIIAELELDPAACYAYGDTLSDLPFLELFGHPAVIDPDPALAAEARKRGWPILNGSAPL